MSRVLRRGAEDCLGSLVLNQHGTKRTGSQWAQGGAQIRG